MINVGLLILIRVVLVMRGSGTLRALRARHFYSAICLGAKYICVNGGVLVFGQHSELSEDKSLGGGTVRIW